MERVSRERTFELIFALDVPTEIPRIGFTLEAILLPIPATPPFTRSPGRRRAQRAASQSAIMASSSNQRSIFNSSTPNRPAAGYHLTSMSSTSSVQERRHAPEARIRTS